MFIYMYLWVVHSIQLYISIKYMPYSSMPRPPNNPPAHILKNALYNRKHVIKKRDKIKRTIKNIKN